MELNIVKKILPKEDILVLLKMFDRESEPSLSSHIDLDKWSIKLENAVFIHCYLNGEIIGTLAYYIGEYIFTTHIAVKSEYRRLHVAQKMLDSLLLTAKKDIKLIVRKDNVAAIKFYEKNHFQLSEEDNNEYVLIRKAEPSNVHQYEVCVHCPTYNQSPYIEDCLNGFIMQKTTFPFCVVIVDDASTDGNQEIIKQYAEKYPDIIKPVLLQENHFSQKKSKRPYYSSYDEQSKYVAMCEGDDYWTDPLKLQKQVDFMETNPECGLCYTDYSKCNSGGELIEDSHYMKSGDQPILTFEDHLFRQGYIAPMTWLYRKDVYESITDNMLKGTSDGSYVVALEFFYNSKVAFLPINTATYRVSPGSASRPLSLFGLFKYRKGVYNTELEYIKRYTNNQWYLSFVLQQSINELYPIAVELQDTEYIDWCHKICKKYPLVNIQIPQSIVYLKADAKNARSSHAYRLGKILLKPLYWGQKLLKRNKFYAL